MSIADDMVAMANDMMSTFGVAATYLPSGGDPDDDAVAVTVRCKPQYVMVTDRGRMRVMDVSVRASEVSAPDFGDTFTIDGAAWKLSALPDGASEINSTAMGALWQLTLVKDPVSSGRGGA